MTREELTAFVTEQISDVKPGVSKQFPDLIIPSEKLHCLAKTLKIHDQTKFDYLFCLTAADRKDGLHVVYHLTSSSLFHCLVLRVILSDKANPMVHTVSDIWRAAEFYEREVFDLFGIRFENHPNMKRIFLDDDWVGYPLRKDYKDPFMLDR